MPKLRGEWFTQPGRLAPFRLDLRIVGRELSCAVDAALGLAHRSLSPTLATEVAASVLQMPVGLVTLARRMCGIAHPKQELAASRVSSSNWVPLLGLARRLSEALKGSGTGGRGERREGKEGSAG